MSNEIDTSEARNLLHKTMLDLVKANLQGVTKAMLFAEGEAKKGCPVDEGMLRATTTGEAEDTDTEIKGVLYNSTDYAVYVHQGTGIYAVNGDGRKTPWFWNGHSIKWGGGHFTSGQRPVPFMRDAIENNLDKIEEIIKKEGEVK